jgi:PadR family transcriptional regulator PadR
MYNFSIENRREYEPELLKGNIKTLILAVLEANPLHGYGIAKEIERRSNEALSFGEGTVYPALKALHRAGFIEAEWIHPENGPARKVYSLTERGREEIVRRRRTWRHFTWTINSVLLGGTDATSV